MFLTRSPHADIVFLNGDRIVIKSHRMDTSLTREPAELPRISAHIPQGCWARDVEEFSNDPRLVLERILRVISLFVVISPLGMGLCKLHRPHCAFQTGHQREEIMAGEPVPCYRT